MNDFSDWTTEAPREPGNYWFYGDPWLGEMGQDFTDKCKAEARLLYVNVNKVANGIVAVSGSYFLPLTMFDKEKGRKGYYGYWKKREDMELPEWDLPIKMGEKE